MSEKYYKVIAQNSASPTKEFDYSAYLPSCDCAGIWLPEIPDAKIRGKGYYVSKNWRIWYVDGARIFEVECEGLDVEVLNGVEKQGFTVDLASNGEEGLENALSDIYDCVVLDIMLPKLSGTDILKRMKLS